MKIKMFRKLSFISPLIAFPLVAVSCGREVKSSELIEQDNLLSSDQLITNIEKDWLENTVAALYNIDLNNAETKNSYLNDLQNLNATLYENAKLAFEMYAQTKLNSDGYYFFTQNNTWLKNGILNAQENSQLNTNILASVVPNEEAFKIYWSKTETGIRNEINKMLLVLKYFTISDKEQLKTTIDNFKYDSNLKYSLENYNLIKYALEKRMVQIWKKETSSAISKDDFFIKGYGFIKNVADFNAFLENTTEFTKTLPNIQKLTNNNYDLELKGYAGFTSNVNDYGLFWDYDSLSKVKPETTSYSLTGFYDPTTNKLLASLGGDNAYSPYTDNASTSDKAIVVYLNQIAPISEAGEGTDLPISEDSSETKKVPLLTFKNTPYGTKTNIAKLSFIFFNNDSSLYSNAQSAFAKLGYKITINKAVSQSLADKMKEKNFIVVE